MLVPFDPATSSLRILEENNYYPFGLKHQENLQARSIRFLPSTFASNEWIKGVGFFEQPPMAALVPNSGYQYKYNGKEWQDELGINVYDYQARLYMPDIVRTMIMDPHSETYFTLTPYNYVANNPTLFIDPDGKDINFYIWEGVDYLRRKKVSFDKLDPKLQKALESFAKTELGYNFLKGFAKKGDKIGSVEFKDKGEFSNHDIDFSEFKQYGAAAGTSNVYETKDNLTFDVKFNMSESNTVDLALTAGHEAFIHIQKYKNNIINAYDKKDKKEVNNIIKTKQQEASDGNGRKDHRGYLQFNPIYKDYNKYTTQLKSILNPTKVNEAKKQSDERLKEVTY